MPYPGVPDKYTKKMESCVSQVMAKEPDMTKSRAIAICKSRIVPKGGRSAGENLTRPVPVPIRRIDVVDGANERFRCYAVRFNGPDDKDLYGTYFDTDTEYLLDYYRTRPWLYDHGLHPILETRKVGEWDTIGTDDQGVFVEGELDRSHEFHKDIETLIDEGVLYPSSGALSYLVRIADDGHVEQWPVAEVTSTVAPADWRMLDSISPVARSAMRMLLKNDIRNMEVNEMNLEQLKDMLGLGTDSRQVEVEAEADADATEGDEDETTIEAEGDETESDEELELVRTVVEHVGDQFDGIRKAIEGLDTVVHEMRTTIGEQQTMLQGLAKDEVVRTRAAVAGTDWYKNLHVASREGPEASDVEQKQTDTTGDGDGNNDATGWERISGQA